jgi:hypothetical protein
MQSNKLPTHLEYELSTLGVIPKKQPVAEKPERTYEYRKPTFDENGEPDF